MSDERTSWDNEIVPVTDRGAELNRVLETLSSQRARHVCYYMTADDISEIDIAYLARQVAAWETGDELSQVQTETINRIAVELHHDTLPDLEKIEFLSYDSRTGTIRYRQPSETFLRLLRTCKSIERP